MLSKEALDDHEVSDLTSHLQMHCDIASQNPIPVLYASQIWRVSTDKAISNLTGWFSTLWNNLIFEVRSTCPELMTTELYMLQQP